MPPTWELITGFLPHDDPKKVNSLENMLKKNDSLESSLGTRNLWAGMSAIQRSEASAWFTANGGTGDLTTAMRELSTCVDRVAATRTAIESDLHHLFGIFEGDEILDGLLADAPIGNLRMAFLSYRKNFASSTLSNLMEIPYPLQPFIQPEVCQIARRFTANFIYAHYLRSVLHASPSMPSDVFIRHVLNVKTECRQQFGSSDSNGIGGFLAMDASTFERDFLNRIADVLPQEERYQERKYAQILSDNFAEFIEFASPPRSLLQQLIAKFIKVSYYVFQLQGPFAYLTAHPEVLDRCPFFPSVLLNDPIVRETISFDPNWETKTLAAIQELAVPAFFHRTQDEPPPIYFFSALASSSGRSRTTRTPSRHSYRSSQTMSSRPPPTNFSLTGT
jgi:hypothetical protein